MEYVKRMNIYQKVPHDECVEVTGKPPIRLRWVDTDKSGGNGEPNVRSRLVAMEFRNGAAKPEHHSPKPPLEAVRLFLSLIATRKDRSLCIAHIVVSRAYFHAPSRRPTYLMIPEEDMAEDDQASCANLNASLYGTQDAQKNWENKYSEEFKKIGFKRGLANPCAYWRKEWNV